MDLRFSPEDLAFREEVRAFIRQHLPQDVRDRTHLREKALKKDVVTWQRILNKKGWATYSWPKEYGGPGWTPLQRMIFIEENALASAPELLNFNIGMLGPVLIHFGTEAQKQRYLKRAANLDDWWCQGFSEPNAGSDLASLRTTARRDDDHYVINGQKIWTSSAHEADKMMLLVRTDTKAARPQQGISFLLLDDIRAPGVTVRPIVTIDDTHHVNEVFFDDVKVPIKNLVHEENRGWDVAKFLLGHERAGIARVGTSRERLNAAIAYARNVSYAGAPLVRDAAFRQKVAQLELELKALEITQLRVVSAAAKAQSGIGDSLAAILKIKGSELLQLTSELVMDVGGPLSMSQIRDDQPIRDGDWPAKAAATYLYLRSASIYGGSNEIQKNILAKTVLGL